MQVGVQCWCAAGLQQFITILLRCNDVTAKHRAPLLQLVIAENAKQLYMHAASGVSSLRAHVSSSKNVMPVRQQQNVTSNMHSDGDANPVGGAAV